MKKGMDAKQKAKTETIPYSISAYAVMLTLVSFLGFLIENTWIVLTEGFVDNRNMNAPFLIGYGVIVLLIYRFMGTPEQLTGILQFARGWTRHGRISWSYEALPLHITRYTSLPTSVSFAFLIVFFMGIVYTPAMKWITRVDNRVLRVVSLLLVLLLVLDCGSCFLYMRNHRNFYYRWKIQLVEMKQSILWEDGVR